MAQKAREENENLHQRIVALEARISPGSAESPSEAKAD
jgi:BMFP domain-containing protein YqiC